MRELNQFFIDGQWVDPIESRPFDLINPATEAIYGRVELGCAADVDRAVASALSAFGDFSRTDKQQRVEMLLRIIEQFKNHEAEIHAALTEEMGAPVSLKAQTGAALAALNQGVETLKAYDFETRLSSAVIRHEAIGVAGLITPWNWPIQLLCNKLASALAAGCTVVVKPSEYTPLSAQVFAQALTKADLPPGVFNLVQGDGPGVGAAISSHEDIAVVSFTGSTRAGILVAQSAAESVKRVTQELGGKSANIILPDADLRSAATFNVTRGFSNSGQSCHSPTRILVHEDHREALEGYLQEAVAEHIRVGDPADPTTTHGPVVNRTQYERIQFYIESALSEGARLVTGGAGRPKGLDKGYFVQPTIFSDVTPDMTIAREEIFGMVTSVMTYQTVEEAIALANATPYGLAAYVFTGDEAAALDVSRKMRAGRVFFNGAPGNTQAPMGGYKKSGNGREMGEYGMEEYLEVKAMFGFQ